MEPSPEELQELLNRFGYILTEQQTSQGTSISETPGMDPKRRGGVAFAAKRAERARDKAGCSALSCRS